MRWPRYPLVVVLALLAACEQQLKPDQFAGQWKSSRSSAPLTLHANGEWEIRDSDDHVLQYGVWQLRERSLIWSIKRDTQVQHDANAIVSVQKNSFELRERDGSLTHFERIE
jgi:hypothetical protein